MVQKAAQTKFTVVCIVLQAIMAVLYGVMVRYAPSADSAHIPNRVKNEELDEVLGQYPSKYWPITLPTIGLVSFSDH